MGEYVAFLDDDDEWLPQKLERQLRQIQRSGPDVVLVRVGGFDESLEGAQDRDIWLRLRAHGEFGFTPELCVIKHAHANQISTRLDLKRAALGYLLEKHKQAYRRNRRAHAYQLGRLGLMQCAAGESFRGCGTLLYSFARNPRNFTPLSDLLFQLLSARPAREAHLLKAFIQRDGACRYF